MTADANTPTLLVPEPYRLVEDGDHLSYTQRVISHHFYRAAIRK
jgi:hypothetical protein